MHKRHEQLFKTYKKSIQRRRCSEWLRTSVQLVGIRTLQCGKSHVSVLKWSSRAGADGHLVLVISSEVSWYLLFSLCSSPLKEDACFSLFLSIQFVLTNLSMCSFGKGIQGGSNTATDSCVDYQRSCDAFEPGGLPGTVILSVQRSPSWQIETLYLPECLHNFQGKCSF